MTNAEWPGWHWLPDRTAWFDETRSRTVRWSPPAALGLDVPRLRELLCQAAAAHARWLVHPCVSALHQPQGASLAAHARLAVWTALYTPAADRGQLCSITLPHDLWAWAPAGAERVTAGTHELQALAAASVGHGGLSAPVVPDPWGDSLPDVTSVGEIGEATWWTQLPLSADDESRLASDVRELLVVQALMVQLLPDAAHWVQEAASVVVPLVETESTSLRSGSIAGIPGLVLVEITDKNLLTLEALVHETAHLHFHLTEAAGDLISEGHDDSYHSPLRPDPRPLRGIFLALHALVYMCAFYRDWQRVTGDRRCEEANAQLRQQRGDAATTLCEARRHLSEAGDGFLGRCLELAEQDDQR